MSKLITDTIRHTAASVDALTFDANGNTLIADNEELQLGTGSDLKIYHDGSDSFINDSGTGSLIVKASQIIMRETDDGAMAYFKNGGAVELNYDNAKKLETVASGVNVTNTGNDAELFITAEDNRSAALLIHADNGDDNADKSRVHKNKDTGKLHVQNYAAGSWEDNIVCSNDNTVELFYDNSKKLETTSAGVTVTGDLTVTGAAPGGINNAVVFRKTADTTGNCLPVTDWEKEDGLYLPGEIGTFADPSSGVFTFPSTGYWYMIAVMTGINSGVSVSNTMWIQINVTIDNGGYWSSSSICHGSAHVGGSTAATTTHLLDVTDLSNHKVKVSLGAAYGGEVFKGDSAYNETHVTFIRLGDT